MNKNYSSATNVFCSLILLLLSISAIAQCPAQGDQVSYGDQQWIGYVYSGTSSPPPNGFSSTYQGYVLQNETFELFPGGNALSGPNVCGNYYDNYSIRFKMQKTFAAGYYTFYIGADDGYRLSFDGGATWVSDLSDWADHGFNTKAATLYREGTYNMVLEYYENGGEARVTFDFYEPQCTSTAPTGINGNTHVTCNQGTTLYAVGGVNAIGTTYQWGTGSVVGENVISGQTQETIIVYPTVATTYWVRRRVGAPCEDYTAGVTVDVTVGGAPPGDPAEFGDNEWNFYAYNAVQTLEPGAGNYSGYYTQSTLGFDTSNGTNSWPRNSSPSNSAGWQGCPVGIDNFSFVHKRRGFPCGRYTLVMNNWDDNTRVYVNGNQVWQNNGWSGGEANETIGTYNLDETSTIEVRTLEGGGDANAKLSLTLVSPIAPTGISGNTTVCSGASVTLTATGATPGVNGVYQWGTGTPGENILPGVTTATLSVTPTENTQYWVRLYDTFCESTYGGVTHNVTTTVSGAGTLSSEGESVCPDAIASDISLSGNTGNVIKWQSADDAAFVSGVADIATTGETLTSAEIGSLSATKYFRAMVDGGACGNVATPSFAITVKALIVYDGTWSGTPDETTPVQINSPLTLSEDMDFCSCQVNGSAELTVPATKNLTVKGKITVAGSAKLTVENTGSLIQKDNVSNSGAITVHRNSSKIRRLDYTMWSSPVSGQPLRSFSPATLSTRFYTFNTAGNQYALADTLSTFATGAGYLIRTPNTHPIVPTVHSGTFKGVPHNGDITFALTYTGQANSYNAVGNPYPSPLNIEEFIDQNEGVMHGTLYVWRKANDSATSSYGTVTKFGYAANSAAGGSNDYAIDPQGKLNVGQGFLVNAKAAGSILFTNAMRLGNSTNQFFRQVPNGSISRYKLNISGNNNFAQAVAGYTTQATNGYDNGMDGIFFPNGSLNIYTLLQTQQLAIQAKGEFAVTDVIPVGYKSTVAGTFAIKIDHPEGVFAQGQNVYLKDKTLNTLHNLTTSPYTFVTATGTFNNRFEIVYTDSALGNTDFTHAANAVVYARDKKITVSASQGVKSITVFDVTGRKIYDDENVNSATYTTNLINTEGKIMIVKATLVDGAVVSKKIIME
ncbi:MAG: T9SS sorting signal type C domain-containing protein [Flavobacterium sp.]